MAYAYAASPLATRGFDVGRHRPAPSQVRYTADDDAYRWKTKPGAHASHVPSTSHAPGAQPMQRSRAEHSSASSVGEGDGVGRIVVEAVAVALRDGALVGDVPLDGDTEGSGRNAAAHSVVLPCSQRTQ